ncbi:FkbM family methyltransferase [Ruegeria atlantica]|uniref:Methyltransferase, FkbM family n=1 Tax=Ruegeria atlantica TaxID=81569 RepID=A0A0P1F921_9RHOB|nr:FkbM family methyltransferase [Ruegeria atlantica]CUH49951.1 methyltransferase, FkbM family [Ruegeria atlantica]
MPELDMTNAARRAFFADVVRPYDLGHKLIRVGDFGDGGYLLPNDLEDIVACFSPGVSQQSSFEMDLAKHGIPSFMADGSVDEPMLNIPDSVFIKKHLAARTGPEVISLEDWIKQFAPPEGDMILQMDIEGAEYPVLSTLSSEFLSRFRIIVLELHRIPSILMKPGAFKRAYTALYALKEGFVCAHIHPNNASGTVEVEGETFPRVIEATFVRQDRVKQSVPATEFPHALDRRHRPKGPALNLPKEWVGPAAGAD